MKTHEWCAEGVTPGIAYLQSISTDQYLWWISKLMNRENIYIPRIADMPPEAQTEKEALQADDIQSILIVPMFLEDKMIGFMGCDSVTRQRDWSKENTVILESVASIISKGLQRKNFTQALESSKDLYRTIFENTGAATLIIEEDMTASMVNQECLKLLGADWEELKGLKWTEFIHGDLVETMQQYHRLRRTDNAQAPQEYPIQIKDKYGNIKSGLLKVDVIAGTLKTVATFVDLTEFNRIDRAPKAISAVNTAMIHAVREDEVLDAVYHKVVLTCK